MICVEYYQRILITGIFYYIPFAGFFLSLCGISFCHLPSRASEAQSLLALTKNHLPRAIGQSLMSSPVPLFYVSCMQN